MGMKNAVSIVVILILAICFALLVASYMSHATYDTIEQMNSDSAGECILDCKTEMKSRFCLEVASGWINESCECVLMECFKDV